MFDFASRDQTWWSIQAALQWISTREYKEDPYARLPFDAAAFFSGIAELHEALLEGKLQAYGSFDTASIGPLDAIIWTGSNLVAIWEEHPLMMRMHELQWPSSIIARSYESYPARAIKGPREWCGTPALGKDISDNKYLYRFVTDLVFKRVDVTSVWSTQKKVAQPVRRKKRELATRVEEALQRLTWKGASLVGFTG